MDSPPDPHASSPTPQACDLIPGQAVKVIGGKFNGLRATLMKVCLPGGSQPSALNSQLGSYASINIEWERRNFEVVEELRHLQPLSAWAAGKSATELELRGAGDLAPAS